MAYKQGFVALAAVAAPLALAVGLLARPYAGLPVAVAVLAAAPAAVAVTAPVAPPARVAAAAVAAPLFVARSVAGVVDEDNRVKIAFTGNVVGETDPCG